MGSSGSIIASGGAANAVVEHKFAFTSTTPGLFTPGTGWAFYTGTTGDLIEDIDVWIDNLCGSSPAVMDITTTMAAGLFGIYKYWCATGLNVASGSAGNVTAGINGIFTGLSGYQVGGSQTPRSLYGAGVQGGPVFAANVSMGMPPIRFTANQPLIAYVTQTGSTTGAAVATPAPFSGTIYLKTSTPA